MRMFDNIKKTLCNTKLYLGFSYLCGVVHGGIPEKDPQSTCPFH